MQIRRALKPAVAIAAALTYVASMAGVASAGTINSGQITVSGSPGAVFNFPAGTSPCTTPPPAATLTGAVNSVGAGGATVTALDSTSTITIGGVDYIVKLSRTASTNATVTSTGGTTYSIGDFTVTMRVQLYTTTLPGCAQGMTPVCTMNLRMGLHGTYDGAIPSSGGGTVVLNGGTTYTGGIAISAPGCPSPLNGYHGQSASITTALNITLP